MMPLSYIPLEYASSFSSEQFPEGIVSIAADTLRIITTESLGGDMFNQNAIPLRYTPRKMLVNPSTNHLIIVEGDDDTYPFDQKEKEILKSAEIDEQLGINANTDMEIDNGENDDDEVEDEEGMPEYIFGHPRPGSGTWASCVRIMDISQSKTVDILELDDNEFVTSISFCPFQNKNGENFLCIGTAKDLTFIPKRSVTCGYIHVYRLSEGGTKFELIHKTEVTDIPGAMTPYQGRLLAGVGNILRLYDLGKRKLLRKCEYKTTQFNHIKSIWQSGDRIIVGDIQQSYFFMKYSAPDNRFFIFADDTVPRWLTSGVLLDSTTICAGDKFGSIAVLRLPDHINRMVEEDPTSGQIPWLNKHIIGAPHKLEMICSFYIGETISKVLKTSITPGGNEIILYATLFGAIGGFMPMGSREDIDFFTSLETHMRQEYVSLVGRDHLSFRSYYAPCKNVVDGDLCDQFPLLSHDIQKKIADSLERTPAEVQKKLEEVRHSI
jgi:splicing factor 3B subunit 3